MNRLSFTSQCAIGRSATVAERPIAVYGYGHVDDRFAAVHKIAILTRETALGANSGRSHQQIGNTEELSSMQKEVPAFF